MDTGSGSAEHAGQGPVSAGEGVGDRQPPLGGDGESQPVARHCSTGRLTVAQARILDGWRRQLLVPERRWRTPDHRAPASSSDCIAAAVLELLDDAEPDPLTLIRYADDVRYQLHTERGRQVGMSTASFYLPPGAAERALNLLAAAEAHHHELLPRASGLGIPTRVYRLPVGTLARMAIQRWARRSPATVVAAAVSHAERYHHQRHRARRDMGIGQAG
ncbi:hypothetical protein ACWEVD_00720 [Nocardia thailandica]